MVELEWKGIQQFQSCRGESYRGKKSSKKIMGSEEVSSLKLPRIATKRGGAVSPSLANFSGGSLAAAEPEEPVSPCGQMFSQPNMNCYILCTLGFKDPINLLEFRKTMEETLVKHKRFHSVMVSSLFLSV